MTPPTDSLETALRVVPLVCRDCGEPATDARPIVCTVASVHDSVADYRALAAVARAWARERIPSAVTIRLAVDRREARAYNAALADVAKALGLEDTP